MVKVHVSLSVDLGMISLSNQINRLNKLVFAVGKLVFTVSCLTFSIKRYVEKMLESSLVVSFGNALYRIASTFEWLDWQ